MAEPQAFEDERSSAGVSRRRGASLRRNAVLIAVAGVLTAGGVAIGVLSATAAAVGTVSGWGSDAAGELGAPPSLSGVASVAAGTGFSLALKSDGTVTGWGDNASGVLGVPADLGDVTAVAAGDDFALALRSGGTVRGWGRNGVGQLDVPTDLNGVTAVSAGDGFGLALKSDGTVKGWGRNDLGQLNVPADLNGVTAVSAGDGFGLALKSDGTVKGWGRNDLGQLNVPTDLNGVTAVSAGDGFGLALKSDGTVVAWGDNRFGQTAVPAGLGGVVAVSAGDGFAVALDKSGSVRAWGRDDLGQTTVPDGLGGVTAVSAGRAHTLALVQSYRITTAALPGAVTGTPYVRTGLGVSNGAPPFGWAVTLGALPPGLSLSPKGVVTGTPSQSGTFNAVLRTTDGTGQRADRMFSVTVLEALGAQFSAQLPPGTFQASYSSPTSNAPHGGTPPYAWTVAGGSLPAGLSLDAASGRLSGTPRAAGDFVFTVQIADHSGPGRPVTPLRQEFQLVVQPAPSSIGFTSSPAPSVPGQSVTFKATVRGDAGVPTGSVTFTDGQTPLGSAVALDGSGTAKLVTSALIPGGHAVVAVYSGDATYQPSTSPVVTHTVNGAATLRVSPAVGSPGSVIAVSATGLPPGGNVSLGLDGPVGQAGTATVRSDGTLDVRLVLPSDIRPGRFALTVRAVSSSQALSTTPFLVVSGSSGPPDFVARH